nr:MAG TPA: hypothetical protein [Caudoviricetes sp.]
MAVPFLPLFDIMNKHPRKYCVGACFFGGYRVFT